MKELKIGDSAPEFTLSDSEGKKINLKDFRGKKVALYFYPKDDTPGCTKEACGIRDNFPAFQKMKAAYRFSRNATSLPQAENINNHHRFFLDRRPHPPRFAAHERRLKKRRFFYRLVGTHEGRTDPRHH